VDHGILLQTSFEAPICKQAYTDSFCDQLLSTLAALPHGVLQLTPEIIQLSSNLATVRQLGDNVEIVESLRASSQALLSEGRDLVVHTADRASFQSSQQDYYPPWESEKDVPLHALFAQTYQSLFQQPCIMENVHAGVECSILQERCPFIQEMISIGPTIRCAHTVQENVNLSSIDRVYQLLKAVLQQLPN
jgi:dipeptidase D